VVRAVPRHDEVVPCPGARKGPRPRHGSCEKQRINPSEKDMLVTKKTLVALAAVAAATIVPAAAQAQLAYNVGAFTDYRYRGISQTRLKPALQGGVDYTAGAFYVGAWGSTIKWVKDSGGDAGVEVDLYGGYKGEITKGFTYDVGGLYYLYPSNKLDKVSGFDDANTFEIYGALTYGPATLKYSRSLTSLFGFPDSKGSGYIDLAATFEITDGWMITPHIGRQTVKNNGAASYTDASLTVSKDFSGWVVSAAAVDARTGVYRGPNNKDLGKRSLVLGLKYNF
jgi:uncharacterized protein (TIGR02001 family)